MVSTVLCWYGQKYAELMTKQDQMNLDLWPRRETGGYKSNQFDVLPKKDHKTAMPQSSGL